ncbi:uncharacterized protein LOC118455887 [Neolamprologus brichardi]|uniref:uncharacterized protein LOC118455887 n=1 Tax=Neolamprologus brichardi TaxID=32507 RepID=UPI0016437DC7|nr:uncharacterized protein LOC118455887 [Neolamprologus brichardi]
MTTCLLLLLLVLSGSQASHYFGTVMTFTPKESTDDGSLRVVFDYKLSFRSCTDEDKWSCASGDCGSESVELNIVDEEDREWCQREGVMTREVSSNSLFQLRLAGGDWINNKNGIGNWKAVTQVDLRTRSDTAQPNKSPQTTILPALRVPSNCKREFSLLAFDPDGDKVQCRYGDTAADECNPCTPPSLLTITPSCKLTFHSASRSDEGAYAIQLEMEDFPKQTIFLHQSDDVETTRTPSDALSKIPIRFGLIGFILTWTPSDSEYEENHPICFVVQAELNTAKYHSELRCVIVSIQIRPITTPLPTTVLPSTTTPEHTTTLLFSDDGMGAGKVVGIVFGVGAVAAIVGIALWALNRSSPVLWSLPYTP